MTVKEQITAVLEQLGHKLAEPDISEIGINRYRVELCGEYIGIWDSQKRTFVD